MSDSKPLVKKRQNCSPEENQMHLKVFMLKVGSSFKFEIHTWGSLDLSVKGSGFGGGLQMFQ